jgi:tetrahydromethanopterin S-methyltransferase subunit G
MDEAQTKPTLETILKELRDFRASVEARLDEIETRLDKTQAIALDTRAEVRELKKILREQLNLPV